jgi:hypothetical protein
VKPRWKLFDAAFNNRTWDDHAIGGLAVCDNRVVVSVSMLWGSKSGTGQKDPHRLRIIDLAAGTVVQDLVLPARGLDGGVAIANGLVVVACADGSIHAFGN